MKKVILIVLSLLSIVYANEKLRVKYAFSIGGESSLNVIEDSDGFLWFTSLFSGVLKFNGSDVQYIRSGDNSITNNFTTQIFQDSKENIWIGTNYGLTRYEKSTNNYIKYFKDESNIQNSLAGNNFGLWSNTIVEDPLGFIWFGTSSGLSRYDYKSDTFTSFLRDFTITTLYMDNLGRVWVGTRENGIYVIESDSLKIDSFNTDFKDITVITKPTNTGIIVGTSSNGIYLYNNNRAFSKIEDHRNNTLRTTDINIHNILPLKDGSIVIIPKTNAYGLVKMNPNTGEISQQLSSPTTPFALINNNIRSVYQDSKGINWIIHNDGKIYKEDKQSFKFNLYQNDPEDPTSLFANAAFPIKEDRKGNIWIGLWGQGLQKYSREDGTFQLFIHDPENPETIPNGYPPGFLETRDNRFYVSTFTGFVEWDIDNNKVIDVIVDDSSYYTIIEDSKYDNIFWANGWEMDLSRINRETREIKKFPLSNPTSVRLIEDRNDANILWLPTLGGGLDKFHKDSGIIENFSHNPTDSTTILSNTVFDILQDSTNRIWVTTDRGLSLFNRDDNTFTHFHRDGGYPFNSVLIVLEDYRGLFWLATDIGLLEFNPDTYEILNHYTENDGLHSSEFFPTGRGVTSGNEIWISGYKGINSFVPGELISNKTPPNVFLTSLTYDNEVIPVDKALERLDSIRLDWNRNSFEFEYAALNYSNPEENNYKYILEGYDKEWFDAGTKRFGRYSNLPGGKYTLRVIGSNNDGVWSSDTQEVSVSIFVATPPWLTPFAFILYIISLSSGVYYLYKRNKRKDIIQLQKLENLVKQRTSELEKANRAKSEFLANMSHEIRTPMNAILGFSQLLQSRIDDPKLLSFIKSINSSGKTLLAIINDILDISKIESGKMKLNYSKVSLNSLLFEVVSIFTQQSSSKGIDINLNSDGSTPEAVLLDETRFRQIIINIIGNAVKFTEKGSITISTKCEFPKNYLLNLTIEIEDTGIGIPEESLELIFESFEQAKGQKVIAYGGSGLGLPISRKIARLLGGDIKVTSKVDKGTKFIIKIDNIEITTMEDHYSSNKELKELTFSRARFIIADDIDYNRDLLINYIDGFDFDITECENGDEVIKEVKRNKPDVILLDLKMPVMNGYDVAKKIKSSPETSDIVIIIVSASALLSQNDIESGPWDSYLRKPVSQNDLINELKKYIPYNS